MSAHEDFSRDEGPRGPSERSFGLVFTAVFAVVALWPVLGGGEPRWWAFVLAGLFLALALLRPTVLKPLNRAWARVGLALHRITNPVIMAVIFFGVVTPVALIMRVLGKDPLSRRFQPEADSYWIERRPPGPAPETMRNQF